MPSQKNLELVSAIEANLDQAQALIIADYSGLNVAAQTDLRLKTKAAGGLFTVAKNRLLALALKNRLSDAAEPLQKVLTGPNAVLYGYTDAAAVAKVLVEFAKDHQSLNIKIGLFKPDILILTADQIKAIATLPTRTELLAQLIGQLNAPLAGLVNVLSGPQRQLVYVLDALCRQKTNN
ncbi:50S ribosomal protein L10 [Microgenomates group bacterium RBG_16_45_19]|nr:MAG: 50S ribosomal protein L10 [Microgenomates group bacterium RBG_16_45_19]